MAASVPVADFSTMPLCMDSSLPQMTWASLVHSCHACLSRSLDSPTMLIPILTCPSRWDWEARHRHHFAWTFLAGARPCAVRSSTSLRTRCFARRYQRGGSISKDHLLRDKITARSGARQRRSFAMRAALRWHASARRAAASIIARQHLDGHNGSPKQNISRAWHALSHMHAS